MWIPESKRVWQKEGWTVMCLRLLSPASGCGREDRTNSQIVDGSPWFWPFQARAADISKKRRSTDWPRGYIKSNISDTDPYPTIFILIRNHSTLLSPELAQMEACLDENPDFFMVSFIKNQLVALFLFPGLPDEKRKPSDDWQVVDCPC